jgi:hypothetical protein
LLSRCILDEMPYAATNKQPKLSECARQIDNENLTYTATNEQTKMFECAGQIFVCTLYLYCH